jgi:transcription termination/antitermination protein NusA
MFDLKIMHSVLGELEGERGIPKEKILEAVEVALATAYKKEFGKRGQIVRAKMNSETGKTDFYQVKEVVDTTIVRMPEEREKKEENEQVSDKSNSNLSPKEQIEKEENEEIRKNKEDEQAQGDGKVNFNPEHHILIEDAKKIKRDVSLGDEIVFPLEPQDNFGRIAAQTAKQVIIQKIREAERASVLSEFGAREGEIVSGVVQRQERGNTFVDLGRTVGVLPYDEQIQGERYRPGERIRAYLYAVDESPRGVYLRLSRSHPNFLRKLFEVESPEVANGVVEIKNIAREPGSRSKISVFSNDEHIDPVGSLVGQRGVRVSTVMSELGGERIDVIEWSSDPVKYVEDSLSPAKVVSVDAHVNERRAIATVSPDQQSLAIGRRGQNVRLAAKLTGWRIDIRSISGEEVISEVGEQLSQGPKEQPKEEHSLESESVSKEVDLPQGEDKKKKQEKELSV